MKTVFTLAFAATPRPCNHRLRQWAGLRWGMMMKLIEWMAVACGAFIIE